MSYIIERRVPRSDLIPYGDGFGVKVGLVPVVDGHSHAVIPVLRYASDTLCKLMTKIHDDVCRLEDHAASKGAPPDEVAIWMFIVGDAAVVEIDPETGDLFAWVGLAYPGRDKAFLRRPSQRRK